MHLLLILTFLFFSLYIFLSFFLLRHWRKINSFVVDKGYIPTTRISVIIPVRNEANYIQSCIQSIIDQDYPTEMYEIIVVDDQSFDETADILEKIKNPLLKVMRLGVGKKTTIEGSKKKAIAYGVSHANGDLIVTTDGDCVLPSAWLKNIAALYEKTKAKLIVSPVLIAPEKGLLHAFTQLDSMSTFFNQASGISSKLFYLCSGANLAYEKQAFMDSNPYESNIQIASGDDVFLIDTFRKKYPGEIQILKSNDAICLTIGPSNFKQLFKQRLRWASKMKNISDKKPIIVAAIVWLNRFLPWALLVFALFAYSTFLINISLGIIIATSLVDYYILYHSALFFGNKPILKWYIPSEFIFSAYFLILGVVGSLPLSLEWKDRKI